MLGIFFIPVVVNFTFLKGSLDLNGSIFLHMDLLESFCDKGNPESQGLEWTCCRTFNRSPKGQTEGRLLFFSKKKKNMEKVPKLLSL